MSSHGMPYQTAGNLTLSFPGHDRYSDNYRELDIDKAIVSSHYNINVVAFATSTFYSFPNQVIIVRTSADKQGPISFSATMNRSSKVNVTTSGNNELIMRGKTSYSEKVPGNVQYIAKTKLWARLRL